MNKHLIIAITLFGLIACNSSDKFKIKGKITNADKETIYLEHIGLIKTNTLDSAKLDANGEFDFKSPSPEYPDFYRLRIGTKTIDFSVDSCEEITIDADAKVFSTEYKLQGSQNSVNIQKLRKSLSDIQRKVNTITPEMTTDERNVKVAEIEADIEIHKGMAKQLILQNPRSTAAYFAIYQKIGNSYLFSPYVKEDKPFCAAVATSYNTFMPEYERSKNLYGLVMDAIKTERKEKASEQWNEVMANASTGYIDIELKDKNDNIRKLSELEGKVVLIDFSAYEMENSVQYTFELRALYNKYHGRGLEIYQVSLDRGKLLWTESTASIPWVCVRDEAGPETKYVSSYNIQSIPTLFLMNRKGVIVSRGMDFKALDTEIAKNL